ncbi:hypothetical protein MY3296_009013 [Beauveria thailandica]
MALVPPEGLETHRTVAIARNLAIVATNYTPQALAQWLSGQSYPWTPAAAGSAVRGALVTGARANGLEEKHDSSDDRLVDYPFQSQFSRAQRSCPLKSFMVPLGSVIGRNQALPQRP